jgi:DNA-binding beta-propeller fold protein YncE
MKKVAIALTAVALAASLAGCSDGSGDDARVRQDGESSFYRPKNLALQTVDGVPGRLLRVLNEDDTLTTCSTGASGELSACGIQEMAGADVVYQMVVHPRTDTLYFLQYGTDAVLVCQGANGPQLSCAAATGGGALKAPSFMALDADGTRAYIVNGDDTLAVCQVRADGTFSGCSATDANGTLGTPVSVGLASGDYGTHAYLLNGETRPVITACTLAPSGLPSSCHAENNALFTAPTTMAFSPNGKYAYIGNLDDTLVTCRVGDDATLSSCQAVDTNGQELFGGIQAIAVDAAGANAYVVNARNSSITHCKLSGGGASFGACSPYSIDGFEVTTDLALSENAGSRTLFVTSLSNSSVYGCALDADGRFGAACIATSFLEQ